MNKSDNIDQLAGALSKVQAAMSGASKDSANPFFKSKYADLAAVWEVAREPLSENGLSIAQVSKIAEPLFFQTVDDKGKEKTVLQLGVIVETVLLHSSGQWLSGECYYPIAKNDPQGVGSAITYGRRYGMKAMIGVVDEDDDGNSASGNRGEPPKQQTARQATGAAVKQAAARQQAKAEDNLPTHTGPEPAGEPTPEQKYKNDLDFYFGHEGSAFKKRDDIMNLCRKLNEAGHTTKWSFKALEAHVQDGFDKAIKQLDETEVQVLVQDLTDIYEEFMAIKNEGRSVATPTGKQAPPPKGQITPDDNDPVTDGQLDALGKFCEIKGAAEIEVLTHMFPDASKTEFKQLTFGEGKKALTILGTWKKPE